MQKFEFLWQPLLVELAMSRKRERKKEREREREKMPFIVATYVYASSQGQRTHSARTKMFKFGNLSSKLIIHPILIFRKQMFAHWHLSVNLLYMQTFAPSRVRALPLAAGINIGGHYKWHFGPSGVRALPLAAGINVGGHYKWHFGPSGAVQTVSSKAP